MDLCALLQMDPKKDLFSEFYSNVAGFMIESIETPRNPSIGVDARVVFVVLR